MELNSRVEHNSADRSTVFTTRAWVKKDSLFYASVVTAALKGLFLTKYDAVLISFNFKRLWDIQKMINLLI